jgi:uncharacterized protein involved in exopolysaccharide biosynthesis
MQRHDEIQLKDILIRSSEYIAYLIKKKWTVLFVSVIFALFGIIYSFVSNERYNAELTFTVEGEQSNRSSLGALSGIAGQFGFDMPNSSSTFSEENIMELLKSRGVVVNTLMQSADVDGKANLLLRHYISINNLEGDLADTNDFIAKYTLDSLNSNVWNNIIKDHLIIELKSENANIINLSYTSLSQEFAKVFLENLIDQMGKMYIAHQTAKTNKTLDFLKDRADSVFIELERSERAFAKAQDINRRIINATGRLKELQLMRSVEVLNTMYLEIIKNLEFSKMTLLNQTPIINIIDEPILPLTKNKISTILAGLVGGFLGLFLSSGYFIFSKIFSDSILDS